MSVNKINDLFNSVQDRAIMDSISTALNNFPFNVVPDEKKTGKLNYIKPDCYRYVQRTMEEYIVKYPNLIEGISDAMVEAQNDFALMKQLDKYIAGWQLLLEKAIATRSLAAHELYHFMLQVYEKVQEGAHCSKPGMSSIGQDIEPFFDRQRSYLGDLQNERKTKSGNE